MPLLDPLHRPLYRVAGSSWGREKGFVDTKVRTYGWLSTGLQAEVAPDPKKGSTDPQLIYCPGSRSLSKFQILL